MSWTVPVPSKMKRWSRSPSQRKKPERAKRSANATVSRALIFWPALKRPCGDRRPAQPAPVVAVDRLDLAPVLGEALAVPGDDDHDDRDRPGDGDPEVDVLDELAAVDQRRERRQVEDQPGREEREERRRVGPVEHALGAGEALDAVRRRWALLP